VLLCAVVLMQETNLGSLLLGAECLETCPSDTAPGHCSPACASCSCGTHANPVAPRPTRLPAPASLDGPRRAEMPLAPSDGHLSDIRHVPKPLVA